MPDKIIDIQKQILKSYHKINGTVGELRVINPALVELILHKDGKVPRNIPMIASGQMATDLLTNFKVKDRIKIRFMVSGSEYNGRWYAKLTIKTIAVWKKNEVKLAREAAQLKKVEENKYVNPNQSALDLAPTP